jgi:hypothetical protein
MYIHKPSLILRKIKHYNSLTKHILLKMGDLLRLVYFSQDKMESKGLSLYHSGSREDAKLCKSGRGATYIVSYVHRTQNVKSVDTRNTTLNTDCDIKYFIIQELISCKYTEITYMFNIPFYSIQHFSQTAASTTHLTSETAF